MPEQPPFRLRPLFCGLKNSGEVFIAADRPHGLIELTVQRTGSETADAAWIGISGFC